MFVGRGQLWDGQTARGVGVRLRQGCFTPCPGGPEQAGVEREVPPPPRPPPPPYPQPRAHLADNSEDSSRQSS
eukprot:361335-Chlamydomonas_euryale.AAC.13